MELSVTVDRKIINVILPKLEEYNGTFKFKEPLTEKTINKWTFPIDIPFSSINKAGVFFGCVLSEDNKEVFYDFIEFNIE
ncbi:MAG: hypothetical protein PHC93_05920 [Candidatus Omnitrophica bacterium]|nr:hypothetical protein [Candidatus Omnitrophota bacterium]